MWRKIIHPLTISGAALALCAGAALLAAEDSAGLIALIVSGAAFAMPVAALFAKDWWGATRWSVVGAVVLFLAGLFLSEVTGSADKAGPGMMVFMMPMLVFPAMTLLTGGVRLLVQGARQASGARGAAEFVPPRLRISLMIAAALVAAYMLYGLGRTAFNLLREDHGQASAVALPDAALAGMEGEAAILGGRALIAADNRTDHRLTAVTYQIQLGELIVVQRETYDPAIAPTQPMLASVVAPREDLDTVTWKVIEAEGYR